MEALVNQPFTFVLAGNAQDSFVCLSGGALTSFPLAASQVSSGVVAVTVTPSGTGPLVVVDTTSGTFGETVNVVGTSYQTLLQQIQGAVMGSFYWDKVGNTLTLYTLTGTVLAQFSITEGPTVFSRELMPS